VSRVVRLGLTGQPKPIVPPKCPCAKIEQKKFESFDLKTIRNELVGGRAFGAEAELLSQQDTINLENE
jgi:hypothetical protein